MSAQELIQAYLDDNRTLQIANGLETGGGNFHLKGVHGSLSSILVAALSQKVKQLALVVLSDGEEAAYFYNDLEQLMGNNRVLFFPYSYKNSNRKDEIDKANTLRRTEALNAISRFGKNIGQSSQIIITYPEALEEKVVTGAYLENRTIILEKGERADLDFLIEMLFEYGFERADFVVEPGMFAVRGGIVDVFSYANDYPIRIELTGDTINSIRIFDPVTQTSLENLPSVSLVANIHEAISPDNNTFFFDLLPNQSNIWFKNFQLTKEILDGSDLEDLYSARHSIIEFGSQQSFGTSEVIDYHSQPQPSFNKNFELLHKNLSDNLNKEIRNIILTDSSKQIERLYSIFEDMAFGDQTTVVHAEKATLFTPLLLSLHEGFIDPQAKIACYTDHQIFGRYHKFVLKSSFAKKEAISLKEFHNLQKGDYVVHIDHGIGQFAGLEKIDVNLPRRQAGGKLQEAIRLIYKEGDILYVSIHSLHRISKYAGREGFQPRIDKLGSGTWKKLKQKTKRKVKDIAKDLIKLYAERKAEKGFAYMPDTYLQTELEASFLFEDTPDQLKSTQETKKDMESLVPMDRLICGDVGFGKTEIAIRAAFKAVTDNKQVAVLVPTTILTMQHYNTFRTRLKDFPCNIDYLNRFKSPGKQKESIRKLEAGETDIIIGTHRLVSKDIKFKDLGLLIIDEEQKFGVATKEKLKALRTNVDTLTLTATPIPRTLQFSLMSARDLSIINTPPPNRYSINTELHVFNKDLIAEAINYEVARGGQVFFVHNRVQNIEEVAHMVGTLCPGVKTVTAHGQMDGRRLEKVMIDFIDKAYDVLVATTIIESGLDIPNVNTIIINNAHFFGLSDLHQMRGRVGRSNKKAFCYLLTPPQSTLTPDARKRLRTIEEFSELGSGFNIAMRDLDIRGAGNLLGAEQSGFINELGFETYHKILDEAVQELKKEEFSKLFPDDTDESLNERSYVSDCQIETDMEILIPDDYVNSVTERLGLYKELNDITDEENLMKFKESLQDRFGTLPEEISVLMDTIQLRWIAAKAGFEKLVLKQGKFIGHFISDRDSPYYQSNTFTGVLDFVSNQPRSSLKENNNKLKLTFPQINSIALAKSTIEKILELDKSGAEVKKTEAL